jgi:hypothetical protein
MSAYRTGSTSVFDADAGIKDNLPIKTSVDSFSSQSLESAEHFNSYFDAVIKLESVLPSRVGSNITSYYADGSRVVGSDIITSYASTGVTITSPQQEFQLSVPTIFGATPFSNRSFGFIVRADTVVGSGSTQKGVYAGADPTSEYTWNTILGNTQLQCGVYPVSGSLYKVRVNAFGPGVGSGLKTVIEEMGPNAATTLTAPYAQIGVRELTEAGPLQPTKYVTSYVGFGNNQVAYTGVRPFAYSVLEYPYGGYGTILFTNHVFQTALSSTHSAAGFGGFARLQDSALNYAADQYATFRVSGFHSNSLFTGVPFGCMGLVLRSNSTTASHFTGYCLVFGDRPGVGTDITVYTGETAPRTAYIARMNDVDLNIGLNATTQVCTGTGLSSYVPNMTAVTSTYTLVRSSSTADATYRFAVNSNVVTLEESLSGSAWSTVLTYTDNTGDAITTGVPGFFSISKVAPGGYNVNRWLFLDNVAFGNNNAFSPINIKIHSHFLQTGLASSASGTSILTSGSTISGTTLSWNSSGNTVVGGKAAGLPWQLGDLPPQALVGSLKCSLYWDPDGYHWLDYSALLRLGVATAMTDAQYLNFTMTMGGENYLLTDSQDGKTFFELGLSNSNTATTRDTGSNNPANIGYIRIPATGGYVTFSQENRKATFRVPLSLIPAVFRTGVRTVYVKGTMRSSGLDAVYISDLTLN